MRADSGEAAERAAIDCLESLLRSEQIDCERQAVVDGRENLIAIVHASGGSTSGGLLLNSHIDTVPVANMAISPFDPVLKDGRIFGRGSCDAKASIATMLAALLAHAQRPQRPRPVLFLATVDEEFSFRGSRRFIERSWPVSAAVVGEPTELTNVIAHKGVVRWRLQVRGVSAHGATPELGRSAIYDGATSGRVIGTVCFRTWPASRTPAAEAADAQCGTGHRRASGEYGPGPVRVRDRSTRTARRECCGSGEGLRRVAEKTGGRTRLQFGGPVPG